MGDYVLSNAAAADLDEIYVYSHRSFGEARADAYYADLSDCLRMLVGNPRLGRPAGTRHQELMRHAHAGHVIYYLMENGGIFVVRVLHHSMDSQRHMDS
ncbi:type II toxin-antitoxin system RelE/ParE family toxin [Paramagnetospirillum kuznetsovii]|uniref:Toxin n=1 Tax=Paramagnetospirillum kuznetsovii TaxID=2053833 RepID=A0A364P0Q7_9PROT|nr:type II toxin-antitoxin system RelE/ParE family toxin [Paramagnetospirillum kuznetsovii]RAU22929.1 type II toxin-antitoxin system RelE/ParE family toxin [Paramagnetospirillum kuznetsovii]